MSEPWEYVFNAIGKQLSEQGDWLRLSAREALAKRAVAAIENAGFRLLPSGGKVSTQWGVRAVDRPENLSRAASEKVARAWFADAQEKFFTDLHLIRRSEITWPDGARLIGPWEVVSDTSKVPDVS